MKRVGINNFARNADPSEVRLYFAGDEDELCRLVEGGLGNKRSISIGSCACGVSFDVVSLPVERFSIIQKGETAFVTAFHNQERLLASGFPNGFTLATVSAAIATRQQLELNRQASTDDSEYEVMFLAAEAKAIVVVQ